MRRIRSRFEDLLNDRSIRVACAKHAAEILIMCDGSKTKACDVLGISYHTLRRYLKDYRDWRMFKDDSPSMIGGMPSPPPVEGPDDAPA